MVDVGAAVRRAQGIDQVINAVQVVFMFAGRRLLVLYSALVATEDERRREAAVMRVYGASRAQVTGSQRVEFLAMGLLAGVLATAGAAAIGSCSHGAYSSSTCRPARACGSSARSPACCCCR